MEQTETDNNMVEIVGYTGALMQQGSWSGAFELGGIFAKDNQVIILREHQRDRVIGYGQVSVDERGLIITGSFSKSTPDAIEVKNLIHEGIPMQASVGIMPVEAHYADEGELVNGRPVPAGTEVWTKAKLLEISICSLGTDGETSVRAFAKEVNMDMQVTELETKELTREEADALMAQAEEAPVVEETVVEETVVEETVVEETVVEETTEVVETEVAETEEETTEETEETEEVVEAEAPDTKEKELSLNTEIRTLTQADIDAAVKAERARVMSIFSADAPLELSLKAIEDGLDEGAAFKMFYLHEKDAKAAGLKELAQSSVDLETNAGGTTDKQLGYMDLIDKVKLEEGLDTMSAVKKVREQHPEAYTAYLSK